MLIPFRYYVEATVNEPPDDHHPFTTPFNYQFMVWAWSQHHATDRARAMLKKQHRRGIIRRIMVTQ
jgi:hypothetical protein